jgi:hypothetical protein
LDCNPMPGTRPCRRAALQATARSSHYRIGPRPSLQQAKTATEYRSACQSHCFRMDCRCGSALAAGARFDTWHVAIAAMDSFATSKCRTRRRLAGSTSRSAMETSASGFRTIGSIPVRP